MALGITRAYAVSAKFLHGFFFKKYTDFQTSIKAISYNYYKKWVFKPIFEHRIKEF